MAAGLALVRFMLARQSLRLAKMLVRTHANPIPPSQLVIKKSHN